MGENPEQRWSGFQMKEHLFNEDGGRKAGLGGFHESPRCAFLMLAGIRKTKREE